MDKSYLNIFNTRIVVFYLRLVWLQHQQRAKLPLPYPLAHPCPPHPSFLLMLQSVGLWLLHTHLLTILGHPCHRHKNTHSLFKTITFPRSSLSLSLSQSHNLFSFFPCLILVKILPQLLVFLTDLPVSSHSPKKASESIGKCQRWV